MPGALRLALAVGLVWFHVRLLWQRVADQTVFEAAVAVKWLATGLLVLALWRLRAHGHKLFRGRRVGVIWLLALLLHLQLPMVPVMADAAEPTTVEPIGWLWSIPAVFGTSVALALGLLLTIAAAAAPRPPARRYGTAKRRLGAPVIGSLPALASRPPPLLS